MGIEVGSAHLLSVEPWGPGTGKHKPTLTVEVNLTFRPSAPPIQLGRLQLCYGDKRIDTGLPTKLVERVESYTIAFTGSHSQLAGDRRENEYHGRICALAGGQEWQSDGFRFA